MAVYAAAAAAMAERKRPLVLLPPAAGVKPKRAAKNKCAFTGVALPKRVAFVSANAPANALGRWIGTLPPAASVFVAGIYDYLSAPPFHGASLFDSKPVVKAAGARWKPNEAQTGRCFDRSVPSGWWMAPDEQTLERLLLLPLNHDGVRHWEISVDGFTMGETQMSIALTLLQQYRTKANLPKPVVPCVREAFLRAREDATGVAVATFGGCGEVPQWTKKAADSSYLTPWLADPQCPACERFVSDQFLDCGCDGVAWERCPRCTAKYRADAPHACAA